jgi:carbonic anhydrase
VSRHGFETDRRGFVKLATLAAGVGLFAAYAPRLAFGGEAQALMLSCMDYRMVDPMAAFMNKKGLDGKYDHVVLAGASLGVVSDKFKDWHETFWEHLKVSIDLHKVHEVIVIDHRDCGAYKLALGAEAVATAESETAAHAKTLRSFASLVRSRHADLGVEAYLMALDGTAEQISA